MSFPLHAPPTIDKLGASEAAVLRAALGGLSNAEIAALRGRSRFTIQNQLAANNEPRRVTNGEVVRAPSSGTRPRQ